MTLGELLAFYLALALLSSSLREIAYAIPKIVVGHGSLTTLVGLKQQDPNPAILIITQDMDLVDQVENVYVLRARMISDHRSPVPWPLTTPCCTLRTNGEAEKRPDRRAFFKRGHR